MTTTDTSGYLATAFRDADRDENIQKVINAINLQYSLECFRVYKNAVLDHLWLRPGSAVADLGSGLGYDAVTIGEMVGSEGSCVGVDASATLVAVAHSCTPADMHQVSFAVGPAEQLDIGDNTLDAVKADRLLMHVEDPQQVLVEAFRVLKPGGRAAFVEPDWGTFTITSADRVTTRRFADEWCDSFQHGWIGRDLPHLLRRVGFRDVELSGHLVVVTGFPAIDQLFEISNTVERLKRDPELREPLTTWLNELRSPGPAGSVLSTVTMFLATGTR